MLFTAGEQDEELVSQLCAGKSALGHHLCPSRFVFITLVQLFGMSW